MSRLSQLTIALSLVLPSLAVSSIAQARSNHPRNVHVGLFCFYCNHEANEAYPNDTINGERVPAYVFNYADRNNDGVLRGQELNRALMRIRNRERRHISKF